MLNNNLAILKKLNIDTNSYIVVGCSAGPDSMALIHLLKSKINAKIICAHINHNIRTQSAIEELYLKEYCQQNNIIFESIKIEKFTENNFENEARKKRYLFYEKILNKYNSKYLFLAHHGDDLIETIIMKINRGSNLEGYAGIKEITKRNNYYIIRPFLSYTKKDLIEYNQQNNIKYYIDNSNFDEKYTRNRIRKNILPALKEENKNIHKQFLLYSKTLLEYNDYLNREVDKQLIKITNNNIISLDLLTILDPFLVKNILYKYLNRIYLNQPNIIKKSNIQDILNMINSKKPNLTINLPKNKVCIKEYNQLYIADKRKKPKEYKIELKEKVIINNIIIEKISSSNEDGNNICRINSKNIKLPLYIRNKKNGDFIELKGLNKKKKLKDIFIDEKIPKSKRENYPILVDSNDNILWIPNIKKSKFNAKKDQLYDIILKYCEKEDNNE